MKFVFLIYHDETTLDALPPREMQTLVDGALDYDDEIRRSGHYIVSNALQRARTARTRPGPRRQGVHHRRTLRRDQGAARRLLPRSRPRTSTRPARWRARFPPARLGTIEVRPIQELEHS